MGSISRLKSNLLLVRPYTCSILDQNHKENDLLLVEFAYNNIYHVSIHMAPYEALYERPCRSLVYWTKIGERSAIGPDLVKDTSEKVDLIRKRLLMAQSWQKSYADKRWRPLELR